MANTVQTFFLPHDKLLTWLLSALKGVISAFLINFLQISAHSKSDANEVAL